MSTDAMPDVVARLLRDPAVAPASMPRSAARDGSFRARAAARRWEEAFRSAFRGLAPPRVRPALRRAVVDAVLAAATDEVLQAAIAGEIVDDGVTIVPSGFHLLASAAAGRPPELGRASPLSWAGGFMWIMDDVEPELLRRMLAPLIATVGRSPIFADLDQILARAPPRRPGDRFRDAPHAPIQLARSTDADADTLLVCAGGRMGRMGMPINLFHRWAAETSAHLLYIRAAPEGDYRDGVPSLAADALPTAEIVRRVADALGVRRIGVYGVSAGGFPGAALGLQVGADRVVVAAGSTQPEESGPARRRAPVQVAADRHGLSATIGALAARAARETEILCIFAAEREPDRADAEALAGVRGVRLQPLPGAKHNVGRELARIDALRPVLAWATGRRPAPDAPAFEAATSTAALP